MPNHGAVVKKHKVCLFLSNIATVQTKFARLCFHICLSVHRGDVYLWSGGGRSVCHTLPGRHPTWADTPLPSACWDTHLPCPVHAGIHPSPAQCMLGYSQQTSCEQTGSTHPTGMHSFKNKFLKYHKI